MKLALFKKLVHQSLSGIISNLPGFHPAIGTGYFLWDLVGGSPSELTPAMIDDRIFSERRPCLMTPVEIPIESAKFLGGNMM